MTTAQQSPATGGTPDYVAVAAQLQAAGDIPAAAGVLQHGLAATLPSGLPVIAASLGAYARIAVELINLLGQAGDPAAAVGVAVGLRKRLSEAGYRGSELFLLANLIHIHVALDDLAAAGECAVAAARLRRNGDLGELAGFEAPDAEWLSREIAQVAYKAYYSAEDYKLAAMMAELVMELDPNSSGSSRLLAFSRFRLGELDDALVAFDEAITLDPEPPSRAGLFTGKAAALQAAGRFDDAIASMTQAIALVPGHAPYFMSRGQLNSAAGDHERAVADFDKAIRLAGRAAARQRGPAPAFRSRAEYERNMPAADVKDFASLLRMAALWDLGRPKDAVRAAAELARSGSDLVTRAAAQRQLGDWYLELGDMRSAERVFTAAIDAGSSIARPLLGRARARISLGKIDDALADLEALCGQDSDRHDPQGAAAVLSGLLDSHPELTRARLALGHALLLAWRPAEAMRELDAVIDQDPGNWEALRWRGMCRVTHSGPGGEPGAGEQPLEASDDAWNNGMSLGRIWDALEDLVAAATAAPAGVPIPELSWFVDRVLLIDEFETRLMRSIAAGAGPGHALAGMVPAIGSYLRQLEAVGEAISRRDWAAAAAALAECRAVATAAGLTILAAKADLLSADVLLRQFELQRALDHVAIADLTLPTIGHLPGVPYSREFAIAASDADWSARDGLEGVDAGTVINLDFDHLEFSMAVTARFLSFSGMVKAAAAARTGDPRKALQAIYDLPQIEANAASGHNTSYAFGLVPILRDAGEYSRALALIDAIRPHVEDEQERERLTVYEASTYRLMGNRERAVELLEEEVSQARSGKLRHPYVAVGNLASVLHAEDPGQALSLLDEFRPPDTESVDGLSNWHVIRGQALLGLERYREALDEFTTGLDLRDQVRGRLRDEEARISWQAERLSIIDRAVLAGIGAADNKTAFELAERGKARAFVDQLELGHPQVTPEAAEIATAIDHARERRQLLRRLIQSLSSGAAAAAPEDLAITLRKLEALGVNLRRDAPVTVERVSRQLHTEGALIESLEARFRDASIGDRESVAGAVAPAAAIQGLLARDGGQGHILLAEYFTVGESIFVFLIDGQRIDVRQIAIDEPAVAAIAQSWLAAVSQGRTPELDGPGGLDALEPLIEPLLDACAPGDLVWIVPHGVLHYLPLHAIPVRGQRLIKRNPVIFAPSASVLAHCRARRDGRPRRWRHALVLGDSQGNLPHAREEALIVADLLGVPAMIGEAATKPLVSALRSAAGDGGDGPDVIHLACHGVFDADQPLRSGIVLAAPAGGHPDEALLTAEEVFGLRLTASLVTLSACDSGLSVRAPGEELLGLTRAFLIAGAAAVLVSLWPVDDLSTGLLMEAFYKRLLGMDGRPAARAAQALREAQSRLMNLTADEGVAIVEDRIARTEDPLELLYRRFDLARLRIVAGDLPAAISVYAGLQQDLAGQPGPLAELVDQRLRLLRFKSEAAASADYGVRPFEDPRYWAAFALVGDWE